MQKSDTIRLLLRKYEDETSEFNGIKRIVNAFAKNNVYLIEQLYDCNKYDLRHTPCLKPKVLQTVNKALIAYGFEPIDFSAQDHEMSSKHAAHVAYKKSSRQWKKEHNWKREDNKTS